jgi:glycosyltransferase involved in cell wall biosynthesis
MTEERLASAYPIKKYCRPKILYLITRADEIGGAQVHVRDMAEYINKHGADALVVTGGREGVFTDQLKNRQVNYKLIRRLSRKFSPIDDLIAIVQLYRQIILFRPDILSAHSAKAGILGRMVRLLPGSPPVIFTAHGWAFADGVPIIQKHVFITIEKLLTCLTTKIITVCRSDKAMAMAYGVARAKKIVVIYNGMPYKDRQENRPSSEEIKIICVARFEKQKDHVTLIRSLKLIKELQWQIELIGAGDLKANLENLVKESGIEEKVKFTGRTSQVGDKLDEADIFVLSSLWEGFPRSIIEAMRSGLPIIATDVGGVSESVINNFNGICVDRRDEHSLALAIRRLILDESLRVEMGIRSRSLYESKFTFETMAKETVSEYINILKNHKIA